MWLDKNEKKEFAKQKHISKKLDDEYKQIASKGDRHFKEKIHKAK
jgi:hypothetical protein